MIIRRILIASLFTLIAVAWAQNQTVLEQQVRGNKQVSKEAILAATKLEPGTEYTEEKARQDSDAIYTLGLFESVLPHAEQQPNGVIVVYDVVENPIITNLNITGNTVLPTVDILKVMKTKTGQVLNHLTIRSDIQAIRKLFRDKGYIFIGFSQFEPDPKNTSTLNIKIDESRIGKINIIGNKRTKTYVIKEEMRTRVGQVFSIKEWEGDIYRIYNRGYFEDVTTGGPRPLESNPNLLELDVIVKERRTGQLNVGVGYDQREGIFGLFEIQDPNFLGRGETVGVSYQRTGTAKNSIEANFADPVIDRYHTGISLRAYDKVYYRFAGSGLSGISTDASSQYEERRRGGELTLNRPFAKVNNAFLTLRTESIATKNVDGIMSEDFIQQDGSISSVSLGLIQNRRDVDFDPSRGYYIRVAFEFGKDDITKIGGAVNMPDLLGTHDFTKSSIDMRYYYSLQGARKTPNQLKQVLALRLYYARADGILPFWEQFFVGGAESLRGYEEDRFWGQNAFIGSLEYRIPIQKTLAVLLFADYGDAWGGRYGNVVINGFAQHSAFAPSLGYGAGVHFQTPLGPLRLDFGINEEGNVKTHFRVGHTF
ncbi:MAG: BamA/TamA family outer membrane protein [bacterium]